MKVQNPVSQSIRIFNKSKKGFAKEFKRILSMLIYALNTWIGAPLAQTIASVRCGK